VAINSRDIQESEKVKLVDQRREALKEGDEQKYQDIVQ